MPGRQIRWASAGKIAAIAAAALAGVASLPAVLGSDAPPPVPADVGVVAPPSGAPPAAAPTEARLPTPSSSAPGSEKRLVKEGKQRRRRKQPHRHGVRVREQREHPHRIREQSHRHAEDPPSVPALPLTVAPPVYSQAPPPSPGEFRIEP